MAYIQDFSTFTYDSRLHSYEKRIPIAERDVELYIHTSEEEKDKQELISECNSLIELVVEKLNEIKEYSCKVLLDTYNDNWGSEDISSAEFIGRLKLESIIRTSQNEFEVHFETDMFEDHVVQVRMTKERGFVEALI